MRSILFEGGRRWKPAKITVFFEEERIFETTDSEESDREGAGSPQRCGRSKVHIVTPPAVEAIIISMGRIPEAVFCRQSGAGRRILKTITRWHLRTTMKYI